MGAGNTRQCGKEKEELAAAYLEKQGVRILCRNFRSRQGEIDLVGEHGDFLVFFEVKYRSNDRFENPLEAVSAAKQQRICRTADYYRLVRSVSADNPIRYDVVGIRGERIEWIQNAFPHRERKR